MPHGRLPEVAEASQQRDEDCAALLRSLRRCRSSQQLTTIVVLCLPVLVSAQVAAGPRDALQVRASIPQICARKTGCVAHYHHAYPECHAAAYG